MEKRQITEALLAKTETTIGSVALHDTMDKSTTEYIVPDSNNPGLQNDPVGGTGPRWQSAAVELSEGL